jgi:DNA polymerase
MNGSLHNEYLDAMGVQRWVARDAGAPEVGLPERVPENVAAVTTASPRAAVAEAPDWPMLEAEVSACTRCELHETRSQTVFGTGNRQADWMIIGEAPGAGEDRQGEPFVGRAGQLLNEMLFAAGYQRADVYIANVIKCRPPNNRDPSTEQVASCRGYLERQIELVSPKLILAVGRIAAHNLMNIETPLGRLRGKLHRYGERGIPVVVTYHPAYLLRSPLEKRKVWEDLLFAQAVCREQATV